ncbi:MAG TPA: type I methionyl aminopeptidase [Patescibacteria group bacterium]
MIPIKKPNEIAIMEKAGKILADVLYEVCQHAKPGVSEIELDRMAEELIVKRGGEPGFKKVEGYHHTLCVATNNVVVHGIPGNYKLKEGDIIGLDCGVYLEGFHTDMAETVYVGDKSKMPEDIKRFLELGKQGMLAGIEQVKPGNRVGHVSKAIQDIIEKKGGYGVTRSLIGHGVGRELHEDPEVPGYLEGKIEKTPLLRPGMTIAVEVIYNMGSPEVMYSGEDDWTIVSADGSLGGLFERTVLVTPTGHKVITES